MRAKRKFTILFAAIALFLVAGDTLAIIGAPATPMSYAGAARRTVRRGY
jgi:hypothetical protein